MIRYEDGKDELKLYSRDDDEIAETLYWDGLEGFESETIRMLPLLLPSVKCFLDIGSNTGLYALLVAHLNPTAQVYAFEPVPEIAERLQSNIDLNRLDNVQVIPCIVSSVQGNLPLYIPRGSRKFTTNASTDPDFRKPDRVVYVQSLTIDSFVKLNEIHAVDLIKIDTETTEPAVLKGALNTLRQYKPFVICEVLYGESEEALYSLLDSEGYEYFWITNRGLVPKGKIEGDKTYKCLNYLFVPKTKTDAISSLVQR